MKGHAMTFFRATLSEYDSEQQARHRALAKLGWYTHAGIFLLVNLLLVFFAALGGRSWAMFSVLGWGIGLAAHGVAVLVFGSGSALHERLVQRDPW
jgi:hypothetical protein